MPDVTPLAIELAADLARALIGLLDGTKTTEQAAQGLAQGNAWLQAHGFPVTPTPPAEKQP